ncbi:unnamed protein product [Arctogadus glacialis]
MTTVSGMPVAGDSRRRAGAPQCPLVIIQVSVGDLCEGGSQACCLLTHPLMFLSRLPLCAEDRGFEAAMGGGRPPFGRRNFVRHWVLRTGYSSNLHLITFPKGPGLARAHRLAPFSLVPFSLVPFSLVPFSLVPFSLVPFSLVPFSLHGDRT